MRAEYSCDFGRESGVDKRFKCSNQQECTMRRISPTHTTTTAIPSSMYSMCRRDCCLSIRGIISSATSSRGMASGGKLDLSTHCRYSFLFPLLRKYFNNVVSHRKHRQLAIKQIAGTFTRNLFTLLTYELAQIGATVVVPLDAKDNRADLALTPSLGDAESSKNPYKLAIEPLNPAFPVIV